MICRQAGKWHNCQKHIPVLFSGPGNNERLKEPMQRSITHTSTHTHTHLLSRQPSSTSPCLLLSPHPLFLSYIYIIIIYVLPLPSACHETGVLELLKYVHHPLHTEANLCLISLICEALLLVLSNESDRQSARSIDILTVHSDCFISFRLLKLCKMAVICLLSNLITTYPGYH